ncbi:hypothetical protein IC582_028207 [Cucumis melo]
MPSLVVLTEVSVSRSHCLKTKPSLVGRSHRRGYCEEARERELFESGIGRVETLLLINVLIGCLRKTIAHHPKKSARKNHGRRKARTVHVNRKLQKRCPQQHDNETSLSKDTVDTVELATNLLSFRCIAKWLLLFLLTFVAV